MLATLERELHAVRHRLGRATGLEIEPAADMTDRIVAGVERDLTAATIEALTARERRLVTALSRARRGEYGVCSQCGQRIASKRLKALPDAEWCLSCQQGRERGESR